ncbi:hypothetical protein ACH5RR_006772 [Cinchona calisaya]|uniref:Uncharacterized protein n=1 Tax=Cinchona calisaya TaxID=153742 RepID=A0ABD3APY3_9GENT
MLIQSLIPGTIEGAISFVSHIGTQSFSCDQIPGSEICQDCPHFDQHLQGGFRKSVSISDGSCSLDIPSISLQISSCTTMSGSSAPMCVYNRRKHQRTSHAIAAQQSVNTKPGDGSYSSISSDAPSGATKVRTVSVEAETEGARSPCLLPVECNKDDLVSKSGSSNGCLVGEEPCSEEALRYDPRRVLNVCGIDDSCSSSKLNLDVVAASFKTETDDTGECSSSCVLLSDRSLNSMSAKDICISVLRSQGIIEKPSALLQHAAAAAAAADANANCCSRKCKVCNSSETTLNMLICDNCEDAFHVPCCHPRIKKIPIDEWFCYSCLKKKRKILKEKSASNSLSIGNESSLCRNTTSEGELGPIESILKDMEPSKFPVRIGHEFQAEIPDWPHPIIDEVDSMIEPEEMIQSEYLSLHNSNKTPQLSSIGNWVQCQEVIEGTLEDNDGTVCGKWRRAPLFEVQTDDWECFRAVLWDPAHADCAVPQELPTDEVLRQLKYIERLRPRLAAKKRKLDQTKTSCSTISKQE